MRIEELDLSELKENDWNPNRMDERTFNALVNAITEDGFLQPLLVRRLSDGGYEVIDGAHRLRAAKECGLKKVSCVIVETDNERAKLQTVMMNRIRGKMDAKEMAKLLKNFSDEWTKKLLAFSEKEYKDLMALLKEPELQLKKEWLTRPPLKIIVEFLMSETDERELEQTLKEVIKSEKCTDRTEALLLLCRFWRLHKQQK